MDLHRSGDKGEWTTIEPGKRNRWQRLAARTDGKITPGNMVSIAGAGVVLSGIADVARGSTLKGILKIGVGRYADILDGKVADKTGTKSPTGEALDAIVDKVEIAAALPVLLHQKLLPKPAFGLILGLNLANTGLTAVAKQRGNEIHPSEEGKMATFGQWSAIGFYGLAAISRRHEIEGLATSLELAGTATLIVSTGLGIEALAGYVKDAFSQANEPSPVTY